MKIYLETFGCQMNRLDSELVVALLLSAYILYDKFAYNVPILVAHAPLAGAAAVLLLTGLVGCEKPAETSETVILYTSVPTAVIARITRSSMLEVLSADYVRTARAKGNSPWRVVMRHAFPNASIPVMNIAGLQLGALLSGAVLTETVFNWPGLSRVIRLCNSSRLFCSGVAVSRSRKRDFRLLSSFQA